MFERFTDRARRVCVRADEEARLLGCNHIGTEHILLALASDVDGIAAKALVSLGLSLGRLREQAAEVSEHGEQPPAGHIPFTPRARKALELALRESLQLGHNYIGTEHILLGLLRQGEGPAVQVLAMAGVDLDAVRRQVIKLLHGGGTVVPGDGSGVARRADAMIGTRAEMFLAALTGDPAMPGHLRSPAFVHAVRDWSRAQAVADLVFEWAAGKVAEGGLDALMLPPVPGAKPPVETLESAEKRAAWPSRRSARIWGWIASRQRRKTAAMSQALAER